MLPRNHPDRIRVSSTTTAWWPMPGCCCLPAWPSAWVWVNWWTATLTWEMRRAGPTPGTS